MNSQDIKIEKCEFGWQHYVSIVIKTIVYNSKTFILYALIDENDNLILPFSQKKIWRLTVSSKNKKGYEIIISTNYILYEKENGVSYIYLTYEGLIHGNENYRRIEPSVVDFHSITTKKPNFGSNFLQGMKSWALAFSVDEEFAIPICCGVEKNGNTFNQIVGMSKKMSKIWIGEKIGVLHSDNGIVVPIDFKKIIFYLQTAYCDDHIIFNLRKKPNEDYKVIFDKEGLIERYKLVASREDMYAFAYEGYCWNSKAFIFVDSKGIIEYGDENFTRNGIYLEMNGIDVIFDLDSYTFTEIEEEDPFSNLDYDDEDYEQGYRDAFENDPDAEWNVY